MAREIRLSRGYVTVVDDEDYLWARHHVWSASGTPEKGIYDHAAALHFGPFAVLNFSSDRDWIFVGDLAPSRRRGFAGDGGTSSLTAKAGRERP